MQKLLFGISGVRGIVGKSLTPEVALNLGKAFGTFVQLTESSQQFITNSKKLKIIVGRDTRKSGNILKETFIDGVLSTGVEVVDIDLSPTPTVLFNIRVLKMDGGVVITASHNPLEWNGFKFVNNKGTFLNNGNGTKLHQLYSNKKFISNKKGVLKKDNKGSERHIEAVLNALDVESIKLKHFKIVLDSAQGALSNEGKIFLKQLGCVLTEETSPREIEPTQANLSGLCKKVKSIGADIGFASDLDGDRLSLVTDKGEALGEEYTLPLVASWVLIRKQKTENRKQKSVIVTNLSTSRMIGDVVGAYNDTPVQVIRTKVGEINVVEKMQLSHAILGGEGNGGIIDPKIQYTRDSLAGMGRILEYMAASGEKISYLANRIPKYYMIKEKIPLKTQGLRLKTQDLTKLVLARLKPLATYKINQEDGIRIDFKNKKLTHKQDTCITPSVGNIGWIHIRPSNTESILRIICETSAKKLTESLIKETKKCVASLAI
ncbi:phosphoglucosamine mutase [candidate division WOR-3 bacterium]|nr:phosphoglucosamine mutase [candidate division WOR-3 bacterium]